MAEHGGYRKPTNPAPVSGPGAHSRRTDGQPTMDLPDAQYGENAQFRQDQQDGPMATDSGSVPQMPQGAPPSFTGLAEPSAQPDVPVTDGAEYGPGSGASALGMGIDPNKLDSQDLAKYLPALIDLAERDDTPAGTKRWVRSIIANA